VFVSLLINRLIADTGVARNVDGELPEGVTAQRRIGPDGEFVFLMNATNSPQTAIVAGERIELAAAEVKVWSPPLE
jgi:beta-galactosidase GanA